jgi:hypothetical protein
MWVAAPAVAECFPHDPIPLAAKPRSSARRRLSPGLILGAYFRTAALRGVATILEPIASKRISQETTNIGNHANNINKLQTSRRLVCPDRAAVESLIANYNYHSAHSRFPRKLWAGLGPLFWNINRLSQNEARHDFSAKLHCLRSLSSRHFSY